MKKSPRRDGAKSRTYKNVNARGGAVARSFFRSPSSIQKWNHQVERVPSPPFFKWDDDDGDIDRDLVRVVETRHPARTHPDGQDGGVFALKGYPLDFPPSLPILF